MEVRCEKCFKLFHVPDEKISAKGIKFVCTRCSEYVIISREKFERYQAFKADPIVPHRPEAESDAIRLQQPQIDKPGSDTSFPQIRPVAAAALAYAPEPAQAPHIGPLEVRCKNCKKLFRVPGNKISGAGIKFVCTRCGEYVKVTREEFDLYIRAIKDVSPPDTTQLKPQRAEQAVPQKEEEPTYKEAVLTALPKGQVFPLPEAPLPAIQPKTERRIVSEPTPEALRTAVPVARPSGPPKRTPTPEKARSRPAPSPVERAVQETVFSRLARPVLFVIAVVVIASLAGYGMVTFFKSSPRNVREAHELSSVEGMLITSVTGAMDANGDILINGIIQNTDEKEKNAWFVVVEVYNKQGALLSKIRLVSGKQIYTGRDYDVLAKRGVNVQVLKEKSLDEQGVIIPPKGTVTFEARYIEPPEEFASFKALLQPFDPVRRFREISEDVR